MSDEVSMAELLQRFTEAMRFKHETLSKLIVEIRRGDLAGQVSDEEAMNIIEHGSAEFARPNSASPAQISRQMIAILDAIDVLFTATGRYGGQPLSGSPVGIFNPLVWNQISTVPRKWPAFHNSAGINRVALAIEREQHSFGGRRECMLRFQDDETLIDSENDQIKSLEQASSVGYLCAALDALFCVNLDAMRDRAEALGVQEKPKRGRRPSVGAEARFVAILAWLFTNLSGRKAAEGRSAEGGKRFDSPFERFVQTVFVALGLNEPRPGAVKQGIKKASTIVAPVAAARAETPK